MSQTAIDDELAPTVAEGWLEFSLGVVAQVTRPGELRLDIDRWSPPLVEPVPRRGER